MTEEDSGEFGAVLRAIASAPAVPLPPKGVIGGRFALGRRLGAGSFGMVYEAEDLRSGGRVAVKILRDVRPDWLYRFKREFRSLSGVVHPNLVVLDQLFSDEGHWFFTMELIEGVDFLNHVGEFVRGGDFIPRLHTALAQLAEGLSALHAAGKVHRDIKPSNVLVSRQGRVVLVDFGLLTEAFGAMGSTIMGTPAYMAPEQAASGSVGPPADLYAVGAMLYQILTGRLPIEGPPLQVLVDKQTLRPPAPSLVVPGVPDDLSRLCMGLLHVKPELRPSAADLARTLATIKTPLPHRRPPPIGASVFVGRGAELEQMQAAADACRKGESATIIICGDSGIGKSSLVSRFTDDLAAKWPEALVLKGRCHEREAIPYQAIDGIVDALARHLSRLAAAELAALLPARSGMLGRVFPVMLRIGTLAIEHAKVTSGTEPHELRRRAFVALRDLFIRVAMRRPTIVVIDDLQWADEDGLRALAQILRPPDAPPLLFLGTSRVSAERNSEEFGRLRDSIPSDACVLELRRLEDGEARELAATLLRRSGSSGDPAWLAQESGGHPLFVEELVRHVAHGFGPDHPNLDAAIRSRVEPLERSTRTIGELVMVAGKPIPQQVMAAAAGVELADFRRHLAILCSSNLVRAESTASTDFIEPYHDRIREALLATLEPEERRAMHEALATAIEASEDPDAETLTMHWREAGDTERAARFAAAAGAEAARIFAFDRAADCFEQALHLLPKGEPSRRDLKIRLGDALALAGRGALAASHFEAAAAESSPEEALDLQRRAAIQLLRSGHLDRGLDVSRAAFSAIGIRIPRTRIGALISFIYHRSMLQLRGLQFRDRPDEQIGSRMLARIGTYTSVGTMLVVVDGILGILLLTRALRLALRAGSTEQVVLTVYTLGSWGSMSGPQSWRKTERLVSYTRELAQRAASANSRWLPTAHRGMAHFFAGRFRPAADDIGHAIEAIEETATGQVFERVALRQFMIQSLAFLGRFKELRRLQQLGLRDAQERGDVYASVVLRIGLANLAWLVEDRADLAERNAEVALEHWSKRRFLLQHVIAFAGQVNVRLYLGDVEGAHAIAVDAFVRTKRSLFWRIPRVRFEKRFARGASALGMVSRGIGDRQRLLREAESDARQIEREDMPWMRAFAGVLRAGVVLHQGSRREALILINRSALAFQAADMVGYTAALRDRSARLRGDTSSAAEVSRAEDVFRGEGVAAPERMIAMLVPGLLMTGAS